MPRTTGKYVVSTVEDIGSIQLRQGCSVAPVRGTRFFIAIMGSLFLASIMGNIICWNAAIIKISELETSPLWPTYSGDIANGTIDKADIDWTDSSLSLVDQRIALTPMQISLLFATSFAGSAAFVVPATWMMRSIGTYWTQIILAGVTILSAIVTPLAAVTNFWLLLVIRFVQGMCQCNPYPVIGAIVSTWASVTERGIFLAVLTGYAQLCSVITTPISSYMAKEYGWPFVFYFQACYISVLLLVWILTYRDDPEKHPFVGEREFRKISTGKLSSLATDNTVTSPSYRVLTKPAVWVCCLAAFAYITSAQFTIAFSVMYYVWILNYSITTAGILSAAPLVAQFVIQFITGICSDKIRFVSEHTKLRICCTLAFTGCAIGYIITSFIPPQNRILSTTVILIGLSCLGFNAGGFPKSAVLIGAQKPVIVMSCIQASITFGLFSGSFIIPGLTPNRTPEEYHFLFRVYGAFLITVNVLFVVFSKASALDFTKKTKKQAIDCS